MRENPIRKHKKKLRCRKPKRQNSRSMVGKRMPNHKIIKQPDSVRQQEAIEWPMCPFPKT